MAKLIITLGLLLVAGLLWRKWGQQRRQAFIDNFNYSQHLDKRLAKRHPDLTEAQRKAVLIALQDYFQMCRLAGRRMVAMPSQVVDDAWHEFILFTRQYEKFCRNGFGRFLHHTPAEVMRTPTDATEGIKRAWRLACKHEGINPKQPERLPRIFAIDGAFAITGGFLYQLNCMNGTSGGAATGFCASHIGCSSGCSGSSDSADSSSSGGSDSGCSGSGCSGGCGGGGD